MDHIVFVSSNYPSRARPHCGTFVRQLVRSIAIAGIKCSVISPVSIFDRRYGKFDKRISLDYIGENKGIRVIRPRYISFSNVKILSANTDFFTRKSFLYSAYRALSLLDSPPTIMYGHFLYPGGYCAVEIANRLSIQSAVAVGESNFWSVEPVGFPKAIKDFRRVNKVIAVSTEIEQALSCQLKIPASKMRVIPNGVDLSLFYPRDKVEMRRKYGLPIDKFIIAFTGHFDERKGPNRLLSATSDFSNIGLLFIGNGPLSLENDKILFKGVVEHSVIPELLSTADIFVLPTLAEGSCNAIIEAMACGLPIISSDGKFNDDILDDNTAIRINPYNIKEIRNAIYELYADVEKRKKMALSALRKAREYNIDIRARKVITWLGEVT